MDEYLDHYFSSSSWSDMKTAERLSWDCVEPNKPDVLLSSSLEVFENDEKSSPVRMIISSPNVECLTAKDTSSIVLGGESDYAGENCLLSRGDQLQQNGENCNRNSSNGVLNGRVNFGNRVECSPAIPSSVSYTEAVFTPDSVNLLPPKHITSIDDITCLSFTKMGYVGCNGTELSDDLRSLQDLSTLSPISQLLPPSFDDVYSLSHVMGQERKQGFAFQGENADSDGHKYVEMNKILQHDNLSVSVAVQGKQDLQKNSLPSSASEPQITMTTVGLPSLLENSSNTHSGGCHGTGKPRVRARRGQATDPHSIAERLRREKIAERMKNLQELVPNSNKTDKASMLDEIIEYVKFLQLQVKVLSMSRLGAAGAVVPLITDGQAEGSNGLSFSTSAGQGVDFLPSADQIAFEHEVIKLMESNVTMAMQYLQSKGLCLMPIALAAAISSEKASPVGTAADERERLGLAGCLHQNNSNNSSNSSLSGLGPHQMSSNSTTLTGKLNKEGLLSSCCNQTVKKEDLSNCTAENETLKII